MLRDMPDSQLGQMRSLSDAVQEATKLFQEVNQQYGLQVTGMKVLTIPFKNLFSLFKNTVWEIFE